MCQSPSPIQCFAKGNHIFTLSTPELYKCYKILLMINTASRSVSIPEVDGSCPDCQRTVSVLLQCLAADMQITKRA